MDEIEYAITLGLSFKTIRPEEEKEMRALIDRYGLASFESLLRVRERGQETDADSVYRQLGVTREWVDGRLK